MLVMSHDNPIPEAGYETPHLRRHVGQFMEAGKAHKSCVVIEWHKVSLSIPSVNLK